MFQKLTGKIERILLKKKEKYDILNSEIRRSEKG